MSLGGVDWLVFLCMLVVAVLENRVSDELKLAAIYCYCSVEVVMLIWPSYCFHGC